ncbi:hypothetical protein BLOT_002789 [Blomia tropicalis]|nr:hypothetical protein BLOT_002789 [Blomia tropicalis]
MKMQLLSILLYAVVIVYTSATNIVPQADGVDGSGNQMVRDSNQYATFTSNDHMSEFGMRNQPIKSDSSGSISSDGGQSFEEYAEKQSNALQQQQQQQAKNEFRPYRISEIRKPIYESFNENNGQTSTISAMDNDHRTESPSNGQYSSPYYEQSTNRDITDNIQMDDGPFSPSPIMSVDEAFRKYFPERKVPEQGEQENIQSGTQPSHLDSYINQASNEQMGQSSPTTQYVNSFAESNVQQQQQQQQHQQQTQPQPSKELFSIDSLREIVEKQPLARPNPFDPPSPPLSTFLPSPPEAPNQVAPQQTGIIPPQYVSNYQTQQSESQSVPQQQYQTQQSNNYVYTNSPSEPMVSNVVPTNNNEIIRGEKSALTIQSQSPVTEYLPTGAAIPQITLPSPSQSNSASATGSDLVDDSEDEGLPYNTENLDDDKNKWSFNRPMRITDNIDNGKVAYRQEMDQIYRKPVSYENDEDNIDQSGGSPSYYHDESKGYDKPSMSPPYQTSYTSIVSPQHSIRPEYESLNDHNRPSSIEYGGFVPIKKPGQSYPISDYTQSMHSHPSKSFYSESPTTHQSQYNFETSNSVQENNGNFGNYNPIVTNNNNNIQGNYGQNYNNNNNKLSNLRFKPLYGRDALNKLRELGINEDEFYGTVNKILQKSNVGGQRRPIGIGGPMYKGGPLGSYMPKANLYRSPPKNGPRPMLNHGVGSKTNPLNNNIADEFDFNYLKDGLPPGASYNPRDVGLDESVLAQIHLQDSGIGGYRFPTLIPGTTMSNGNALSHSPKSYRPNRPNILPYRGKSVPIVKNVPNIMPQASLNVPYTMNSVPLPFVLTGPKPFTARRIPYSATGKGFGTQYGYRAAAASELKPQFASITQPIKQFKFLGQPVTLSSNNGSPLLAPGVVSSNNNDDSSNALGNILGIRSIKGIKSLVSYLTGGVHG